MKLEVGMYARLQNDTENIVIINRIANVFENTILTENDGSIYQGEYTKENVIKASYNIIDILEVGDYANGSKVIKIENVENYPDLLNIKIEKSDFRYGVYETIFEKDVKSVITHEQMEQMAYKVGE